MTILLLRREVGSRVLDIGLGFSSGVMTVASFTSLLLSAIEFSSSPTVPLAGFILGALSIAVLYRLLPYEHPFTEKYEGLE